jgi:tetratricopeptide (TPR) repeat protein
VKIDRVNRTLVYYGKTAGLFLFIAFVIALNVQEANASKARLRSHQAILKSHRNHSVSKSSRSNRASSKSRTRKRKKITRQKAKESNAKSKELTLKEVQEAANNAHRSAILKQGYQLLTVGENERLAGQYTSALGHLQDANRLFEDANAPLVGETSYAMAQAAEGAKNYQLACRYLENCLLRRPQFVQARLKLAFIQANLGRLPEAIVQARQACASEPLNPQAHMMLALLLEKTGKLEAANSEKQRAFDLAHQEGPSANLPTKQLDSPVEIQSPKDPSNPQPRAQ